MTGWTFRNPLSAQDDGVTILRHPEVVVAGDEYKHIACGHFGGLCDITDNSSRLPTMHLDELNIGSAQSFIEPNGLGMVRNYADRNVRTYKTRQRFVDLLGDFRAATQRSGRQEQDYHGIDALSSTILELLGVAGDAATAGGAGT
jgi:hypothetical protein